MFSQVSVCTWGDVCPIACWNNPRDQRQTPPRDQTPPRTRQPPGPETPRTRLPWDQTPPGPDTPQSRHTLLGDMGNKQAVCILLEYILVSQASVRPWGMEVGTSHPYPHPNSQDMTPVDLTPPTGHQILGPTPFSSVLTSNSGHRNMSGLARRRYASYWNAVLFCFVSKAISVIAFSYGALLPPANEV